MSRFISRALAIMIISALAGLTAFAAGKSERINFSDDFQLGGTAVKKGTYKVTFDEATGELSIAKGDKVIAKAKAHAEPLKEASAHTKFSMTTENGVQVLHSVTYSGDDQTIVVGEGSATTSSVK
ncbi:MAG: hypothetical protein LC746_15340 [Acidobacteria bacterium]|nr:hypothetical protein [Acidobacteriota bacterium]